MPIILTVLNILMDLVKALSHTYNIDGSKIFETLSNTLEEHFPTANTSNAALQS